MQDKAPDLIVIYENKPWQEPLFECLRERNIPFSTLDLKEAALGHDEHPRAPLYFNQASPSAYVRGHLGSVPFALELLQWLDEEPVRVINGISALRFELSKTTQLQTMRRLGIDYPKSWSFNHLSALEARIPEIPFPAVLKPNQGGSGARMYRIDSLEELRNLLDEKPELWEPDRILLLQEYLKPRDPEQGTVRMEFIGGQLLYATRIIAHGNFNLCPSETCNPEGPEEGICEVDSSGSRPEFHPYPEIPSEAVATGKRLVRAGQLDIGAVEYLETFDGRRVFFDVNANSNLRAPIGRAYGFDPFHKVVDFLEQEVAFQKKSEQPVRRPVSVPHI